MVTIQKRYSRGHTYWGIVESVRINGKPRPLLLEHLGTAEALLKRLREGINGKIKSYAHGDIALMLNIAEELQIVETINKYIEKKQFRYGFTVGGAILLAAIGRICRPTSKENWYDGWAKNTSLSYLLRMSLSKIDSQFFWDQMDEIALDSIPKIEEDLVHRIIEKEHIDLDTLLCDTTNFFTYMGSTNEKSALAKRGKNKQKRMDLKQFGLLLIASRNHQIPLMHRIYQGNQQDKTIFKKYFEIMLDRFRPIAGSLDDNTLVFDQGNNSKEMLKDVSNKIKFVGALSPSHHKALVEEANINMTEVSIKKNNKIKCYTNRKTIWGLDLTYVVYISEKLKEGQIRGTEKNIQCVHEKLSELKERVLIPTKKGKKREKGQLEAKIKSIISSYKLDNLICYNISSLNEDAFQIDFWIDEVEYEKLINERFGRRILIANRHEWSAKAIIQAYRGQSQIEDIFKNIKNPFHLSLTPQYHWTDHKIEVHGFICILALLIFAVAYKRAKEKANYDGSPHSLLEDLSNIRLAAYIDKTEKKIKGRYKTSFGLEEMDYKLNSLAESLGLITDKFKTNIPFSVYK